MAIIRRAKKSRFVTVGRDLCQNNDLSFEARGVMAYLLSKPDDWEARIEDIEKAGQIGRERRRRIVRELESAGYLERRSSRDKLGHIDYEIVVHEDPLPEDQRTSETTRNKEQVTEFPQTGLPSTGKPSTDKPSTVELSTGKPSTYMKQKVQETDLHETEKTDVRARDFPAHKKMVCGTCGSSDVTPLRGQPDAGTCGNRKCKGAGKSGYVGLVVKAEKKPAPAADDLTDALTDWFKYNGDDRAEESAKAMRGRFADDVLRQTVKELTGKSARGPFAYFAKVAERIRGEPNKTAAPEDERQRLFQQLRREMPGQPDSCIYIAVDARMKAGH